MAFVWTDGTVGIQRIAVDNTGNTEFGSATPSSAVSFSGRPLMNGATFAPVVAAPAGMGRTTGVVSITAWAETEVSCPTASGFGSINGRGGISRFSSAKTSFFVYPTFTSGSATVGYSVL